MKRLIILFFFLFLTAISYSQSTPVLGDFYGGGVVFSVTNNQILVSSTQNLGPWETDPYSGTPWGCNFVIGTSTSIGSGEQNTIDILNYPCSMPTNCGSMPNSNGTAAELCANLIEGGYQDWFLPSKDELQQMYYNKSTIDAVSASYGGQNFVSASCDCAYWSSSEHTNGTSNNAYVIYFLDGTIANSTKCNFQYVRAIRSIAIVNGCTDATSCNYDASATVDDGSCDLQNGCGDALYLEYDALVTCSDAADCFTLITTGCTDSTALNYSSIANTDDGSCNFCDVSIILNNTSSICLGDSAILEVAGNASGWQLYYDQDFESIIGNEWNQSSNMIINSSTVLGQFLNDNIQLSLSNLPQHDSIRIVFDFYSMYTWDGHTNNNGPDQFVLDYDGVNMMNATFSNISTSFGWSYNLGQSYPDDFTGVSGPTYPAGTGSSNFFTTPSSGGGGVMEYLITKTDGHNAINVLFDFYCQNLQSSSNDENWSIDDVMIYLYSDNVVTNTLWSTGDTTASITVNPSQTTTYYVTQIQNGVSCSDSVIVNVNQPIYSTTSITECDSLVWNGQVYTTSIIDSIVFTNSNGCDSTAILNLTINNTFNNSNTVSICSGDSFSVGTSTYNTDGTYTDVLTTINGCDSTVTTVLTIDPLGCTDANAYNYDPNAVCDDGSCIAILNGCTDPSACNYDTAANTDDGGCNYATTSTTDVIACDSVSWNGTTYNISGTYSYTGSNVTNQYSAKFLEVNNNDYIDCGNNLVQGNNFSFISWVKLSSLTNDVSNIFRQHPNDGHWLRFLPNSSQINFKLSPIEVTSNTSLNTNEWYHIATTYDGSIMKIYINGTLDESLINTGGFTTYIEPFILGGCVPCNSGEFFDGKLDNTSIWSTALTQPEIVNLMSCFPSGNEYGIEGYWNFEEGSGTTAYDQTSNGNNGTINGATYDTNVPSQSCNLTNANGCDSTATLNLTINNSTSSYLSVVECEDYTWSVNNVTYSTSGLYINSSLNLDGCMHIDSLDLTIYNATASIDIQTACDSYTWNDSTYTQSGTYNYNGSSNNYSMSFDGVDDYTQIINPVSIGLERSICFWAKVPIGGMNNNPTINVISLSYDFNITFGDWDQTNIAKIALHTPGNWIAYELVDDGEWHFYCVKGFDGTASSTEFFQDGILLTNQHSDGNYNYTNLTSNIYFGQVIANGTTFNGFLDDIHIWNTVLSQSEIQQYMNCPPTGDEVDLVGYWNFEEASGAAVYDQTSNGNNGTINGASYDTNVPSQSCNLTNSNGCDSTATLNLTINNSTSSYLSVVECEDYTWSVNNVTYSTSGLYINSSLNLDGCMHIDSLDLTIYNATASIDIQTACDSYTWNDSTYTQSGTYNYNGSSNNYSMSFDGSNDCVIMQSNNNLNVGMNSFSIESYVRFNSNNTEVSIFDFYLNDNSARINMRKLSNGKIILYVNDDGDKEKARVSDISISTNAWYHLCATFNYSNNSIDIYINGVLQNGSYTVNDIVNNPINPSGILQLAKYGDGAQNGYLDGLISSTSFWKKCLTQQEVQQYMNCPLTGTESDLVGYWNFEEGNGTIAYDQTTNGNDGTINGATYDTNVSSQPCALSNTNGCDSTAILNLTIIQGDTSYTNITACDSVVWNGTTYTQSGTYYNEISNNTSCLDFGTNCNSSGNSWVDCGDVLDMTGSFSVGGWIYNNGCDYTTIISKREGNVPYNGFHLSYENQGNFEFIIQNNVNSGGEIIGVSAISNQWVHVVGVFEAGNSISIYIDGQLANSQPTSVTTLNNNNAPFLIGSLQSPGSWSWDGKLDDIFIYDSALSSLDIYNIYNHCNMPQNSLQGFWNFEEGSGTSVYDQTSNGNDGVINGATYDSNVPLQSCGLTSYNGCDSTAILNLTINQADTSYTNIMACDSIVWNGIIYDSSGTYVYSSISTGNVATISGYDYISSLGNSNYYLSQTYSTWTDANQQCILFGGHLASISSQSENDTIYNGITASTNTNNNQAWIGLYQNTNSSSFSEPSGGWEWSNGDGLGYTNWNPNTLLNSGQYGPEDHGEITNGGYWNDMNNNEYSNLNPSGLRHVLEVGTNQLTTINDCDSTAILNLTIDNSVSVIDSIAICEGESFYVGNSIYNSIGSYIDTLQTVNGCDSVINTVIDVIDVNIAQNDTTICFGDSITLSVVNTNIFSSCALPGNLQNGLVAYYPFCGNANDESGNGNNGTVNGATLTSDRFGNNNNAYSFDGSGVQEIAIIDTLLNLTNDFTISCWMNSTDIDKSSQTLFNSIDHTGFVVELNYTLSPNKLMYGVGPANAYWDLINAPGTYNTYQNNTWYHVVFIKNSTNYTLYVNATFDGSSFVPNSINYTESVGLRIGSSLTPSYEVFEGSLDDVGVWSRALNSQEIQELYSGSSNVIWSTGDTTANIIVSPDSTTTYWITQTQNGVSCTDSVTVTILPTTSSITIDTACDSYTWNGQVYTASVIDSAVFTNALGCDSIAILNLTIGNSVFFTDSTTICDGGSVSVGTSIYDTIGSYIDTLQTSNGCDSIINTIIDVIDVNIVQNDTTICFGDSVSLSVSTTNSYNQGQNQYALNFSQGQYVRIPMSTTLSNFTDFTMEFWYYQTGFSGGDEKIVGTEYFSGSKYSVDNQHGDWSSYLYDGTNSSNLNYWNPNDNTPAISQNIWHHFAVTYDGNKSRFFLNGIMLKDDIVSLSAFGDPSQDLVINRHTWASGSSSRLSGQLDELRISNIARYTMNFTPPEYEFQTDINTMGLWHFNEGSGSQVFDVSGNNNHGNKNGTSWSSNIPFINYSYNSSDNNLFSYQWSTGDTTASITVSPSQTTTYWITQTQNGVSCTDSVTVTILPTTSSITIDTACDSYTWNGQVYTASVIDSAVFANVKGCDSVAILDLTINNPTSSYLSVVECEGYTWAVSNVTYSTSGLYMDSSLNADGCIQVDSLDLTIFNATTSIDVISACDSYVWIDGITYSTSNNSATYIIAGGNLNGCDSIITLDLTINNYVSTNDTITICDGASVTIGNNTYTAPGNYTDSLLTANGCDSIINTVVDVMDVNITQNDTSICSGDSIVLSVSGATQSVNSCFGNIPSVIQVPNQYSTIQQAINSANDGDTIKIAAGNYNTNGLIIENKTVHLVGNTASNTIIDGQNNRVLYIDISSQCLLYIANLTITNGEATNYANSPNNHASAIYVHHGKVVFDNLIIDNNDDNNCNTVAMGNGIDSTLFYNCIVRNNDVENYAGLRNAKVEKCILYNNSGWNNSSVLLSCEVINCTVYNNGGGAGNPWTTGGATSSVVVNSIFWSNGGASQLYQCNSVEYSIIEGGFSGIGNFSQNPSFNNASIGDFSLSITSSAIDKGDPDLDGDVYNYTIDNDDQDLDGTRMDIGALFFQQGLIVNFDDGTFNNFINFTTIQTSTDVTYLWSTGDTTANLTVSPSQTTTYLVTQTENGVSCSDSVNITVNQPTYSTTTIIECDSVVWNGQIYTSSVIDSAVFTNTTGCDSTAVLNLTINQGDTSYTNITDCDSVFWNGTTYATSGVYTFTTTNSNGCDSTAILNLTINHSTTSLSDLTECDSYTWAVNGITYTSSGVYTDISTNANGCLHTDSLNLTINNSTSNNTTITACDSYNWLVNGTTYTSSGTYTDVSTNASGCTHTETLVLTINNNTSSSTSITACDSYAWAVNSITYTNSGIYTDTSTNANGCLHTDSLNLTINNSTSNNTTITDCDAYTWSVNGTTYTSTGTYTYVSTNSTGCTHTETLDLTINNSTTSTDTQIHCDSYIWLDGVTYTSSNNTATFTSTNAAGCNHTNTLALTINNSTSSSTLITDCDDYKWSVNGNTYTASGTYTDTSTNANGCLHTETLVLTINNSTSNSTTITACDSYNWSVNGNNYTLSGTYTDVSTNVSGCNHTETLVLTINNSTTMSAIITECDSYTWFANGTTYTTSGTYTDISTNASGCAHTETLVLSINNSTSNSSTVTSCDVYLWSVNGTTYTTSGTYTDVTTNAAGCNHTETLILTIDNSTSNSTTITDCDVYLWSVNGTTYISSGTYIDVSTNTSGCTHIDTLVLTINNSTSNITTITDCDVYIWSVNGTTYTSSGTYINISTNAFGCIHTETLVLTLNNSTSNITTIMACDSVNWFANGTTYTTSGTYTDISTNANGCLHTEILVLTINSTSNTTTITACDSVNWFANGTTYIASGTYTDVSTNASGCNHTETLVLTIDNSTSNTTTITNCDVYLWSVNGTTYTTSGTYTDVSANSSGCTHTETLVLTINSLISLTNNVSICFGDSIIIGNNTYFQPGIYNDLFTTINGCDSIITTNLNVLQEIIVIISQIGFDIKANPTGGSMPYLYEWNTGEVNGQITPLVDGDYWVIVTDSNECISDTSLFKVEWIHTSVEDFNIDRLIIYPNPSKDVFNIKFTSSFNQDLEIRIINSIGEIVYLENLKNYTGNYSKTISLEKYPKAMYFLEIKTNNLVINNKLILQ